MTVLKLTIFHKVLHFLCRSGVGGGKIGGTKLQTNFKGDF